MKFLALISLSLLVACSTAPTRHLTPPDPGASDAELQDLCGQHSLGIKILELPATVKPDHTYSSVTKVGMLSGAHLGVGGHWEIQGGKLWITAILPPEAGGVEKPLPPFPLKVRGGHCQVAIDYTWHDFD